METTDLIYVYVNTFLCCALAICHKHLQRIMHDEFTTDMHNCPARSHTARIPSYVLKSIAFGVSEFSFGVGVLGLHTSWCVNRARFEGSTVPYLVQSDITIFLWGELRWSRGHVCIWVNPKLLYTLDMARVRVRVRVGWNMHVKHNYQYAY